jgi:hypothetical protein
MVSPPADLPAVKGRRGIGIDRLMSWITDAWLLPQMRAAGPTWERWLMRRIREWRAALKAGGLSRRRRWQLIAAVATFYLVRDLLLYVALPALVWLRSR